MKKLLLTITILLISFTAHGEEKQKPYIEITAQQLVEMRTGNPELIVIDARGGKHFDGVMIKGAVNLPTYDVNAENLAKIIPNKDDVVVFYCTNKGCPAGELAAYKANVAGYINLYDYTAGIEDWKAKNLPLNK